MRSSDPPRMAIAASRAAWRSRWTIWVLTGSACSPRSARTSASMSGPRWLYVPTGPGDLARPDLVDGRGQAGPPAVDLEGPAGELEAHRGRLGVDRVGAAHHRRVRLGPGTGHEHGDEPLGIGQQDRPGGAQLEGQPGVDDVAAGQPEMQVATLRTDRLGDLRHEGDDVVVGRALDLDDPLDVDRAPRLERLQRLGRDLAAAGLGAGDRELDLEHRLEAGALGPQRAHLGQRVAPDHVPTPATATRLDRDVVATLAAGEGDEVGRAVGGRGRGGQVRARRDDGQDAAAGGAEAGRVVVLLGAGVERERARRRGCVEAGDGLATLGRARGSRRPPARPRRSRRAASGTTVGRCREPPASGARAATGRGTPRSAAG